MKKVNKLSIFTYLFLIVIVLIKILSILNLMKISNYLIPILLCFYFIINKFITRNEYVKKNENSDDVKGVAIYLIISLLLYFLLGVVFGFSSNIYSYTLKDIIINIFIFLIPTLIYEYIRYYLVKHSSNKMFLYVVITILIILVNFNINNLFFNSSKLFYIKLFSDIIPMVIKNIILTIIMIEYGLSTCLLYQLIYTVFITYCPYLPSVGYFLNFLILSSIPLIVYSRLKSENKRKEAYNKKNYLEIFTFIVGVILLLFCFGLFNFVPIAAASNSMSPRFKRGDLIIYYKLDDKKKEKIKKDDIIVFNYSNNIYIHRVKKVINKNQNIYYKTKGDANSYYDSNKTLSSDVIGIYKFRIKYIGYPSLWIGQLLK